MTLEFLDQWIAALRSGAFTQTKGSLRIVRDGVGECFCALGVGVELLCRSKQLIQPARHAYIFNPTDEYITKPSRMGYQIGPYSFNGRPPVISDTGFIECQKDEEIAEAILDLNDEKKLPFSMIASYLDTVVRKQLQERLASHGEKTKAVEQRGEVQQPLAD